MCTYDGMCIQTNLFINWRTVMTDIKTGFNPTETWGVDKGQQPQGRTGGESFGSIGINHIPSIFTQTNQMSEIPEIIKLLKDVVDNYRLQSLPALQQAILPTAIMGTNQISQFLPTVLLHCNIGTTTYVLPYFITNANIINLIPAAETNVLSAIQGGVGPNRVRVPSTAQDVVGKVLRENVLNFFKRSKERTLNNPEIIGFRQISLSALQTCNPGLTKEQLLQEVVDIMLREWEPAVLTKLQGQAAVANEAFPSCYVEADKPFGKNGTNGGLLNIMSVHDNRYFGVKTSANLQVQIISNNKGYNDNTLDFAQMNRVLSTSFYDVSLSLIDFNQSLLIQKKEQNPNMASPMGVGTNDYRPFIAHVGINHNESGDTMGNNKTLEAHWISVFGALSFFNGSWREAIMSPNFCPLGGLEVFEHRLDQFFKQQNIHRDVANRCPKLDANKVKDGAFLSKWIAANTFKSPLLYSDLSGVSEDTAIKNSLICFSNPDKYPEAQRLLMATLDDATIGKFTEVTKAPNTWSMGDPVLVPTTILVPHGIMRINNQIVATSSLSEQLITAHYKGGNNDGQINDVVSNWLGINQAAPGVSTLELRKYNIIKFIGEISNGDFEIERWDYRHYYTPSFLSALSKAFLSIGNISTNTTNFGLNELNMQTYNFANFINYMDVQNFNQTGNPYSGSSVFGV